MTESTDTHTITAMREQQAFSKNLFWDLDPTTLDYEKHAGYVIQRVVEFGTWSDWRLLRKQYELSRIVAIAREFRTIDRKALSFLAAVANVPKETFRCYASTRSNQKHWSY